MPWVARGIARITRVFPTLSSRRAISLLLAAAVVFSASQARATMIVDFRVANLSGSGVSMIDSKNVSVAVGSSGMVNVDAWVKIIGANAVDDEAFQSLYYGANAALVSGAAPSAGGWGTVTATSGTGTGGMQTGAAGQRTGAQPINNGTDLFGGLLGVNELGDIDATVGTDWVWNRMATIRSASQMLAVVGAGNFNWINNPGGSNPQAGAGFEFKVGSLQFTLSNMPVGVLNINALRRDANTYVFKQDNSATSLFSNVSDGAPIVVTTTLPEPSTFVLGGLGLLALLTVARRRRGIASTQDDTPHGGLRTREAPSKKQQADET